MYMDATFRVVPSIFHQMFTVFVPYAAHSFPVFFAVMTRKTTELYAAVLSKLHTLQPAFRPTHVMADFEEAPARVVRQVFGNDVMVSGCWFHYAQALVKRLRIPQDRPHRFVQQSPGDATIFHALLALPLLPMADIRPAFDDVKSLVMVDSPRKDLLQKLLRYVERQWITKSTVGPQRLSVRDNPSRSNNVLESTRHSGCQMSPPANPLLQA